MLKTLMKLRLHPNRHKPKTKQEIFLLNHHYPQIYNHLNRNCYQETALLNIKKYS